MPTLPSEPSAASEVPPVKLQPSPSCNLSFQPVSYEDASDEIEPAPEAEMTQGDHLLRLKVQRQVERAMTPRGQHLLPQATEPTECPAAAMLEAENLHAT